MFVERMEGSPPQPRQRRLEISGACSFAVYVKSTLHIKTDRHQRRNKVDIYIPTCRKTYTHTEIYIYIYLIPVRPPPPPRPLPAPQWFPPLAVVFGGGLLPPSLWCGVVRGWVCLLWSSPSPPVASCGFGFLAVVTPCVFGSALGVWYDDNDDDGDDDHHLH